MAPETTISVNSLAGRTKVKKLVTCMPCANKNGSEKMEMVIIGTAFKPRALQNKTGADLGFDYHANKKAWMTTTLFLNDRGGSGDTL